MISKDGSIATIRDSVRMASWYGTICELVLGPDQDSIELEFLECLSSPVLRVELESFARRASSTKKHCLV